MTITETELGSMFIRDLVDAYPETMSILAQLGLDLCCGGGHALGEALTLHGLDSTAVIAELRAAIDQSNANAPL